MNRQVLHLIFISITLSASNLLLATDNSGGVNVTFSENKGLLQIYEVRSNNYPSKYFSKDDLEDYAGRVAKRNCFDTDMVKAYKIGIKSIYKFYGSDGNLVGTFTVSLKKSPNNDGTIRLDCNNDVKYLNK